MSEEIRLKPFGEYGPFEQHYASFGVAVCDRYVWTAGGDRIWAIGKSDGVRHLAIVTAAKSGIAFAEGLLWKVTRRRICALSPMTGEVLHEVAAPRVGGTDICCVQSSLWLAARHEPSLLQLDRQTGRLRRRLRVEGSVSGVTYVDGKLWICVWNGEQSCLHRLDVDTGECEARLPLQLATKLAGLSAEGDRFFCAGGQEGRVHVFQRTARQAQPRS